MPEATHGYHGAYDQIEIVKGTDVRAQERVLNREY
jgi:hypothetical protein